MRPENRCLGTEQNNGEKHNAFHKPMVHNTVYRYMIIHTVQYM